MNPEITNEDVALDTAELLRSLVELLVDRPADLTVDYRMMHGRVDFLVMPNINDQGKVVGKMGAHVKALKFLLARIGDAVGQQFVLRLDEDTNGRREPEKPKPVASDKYSYMPHLRVLKRLMLALNAATVDVSVTIEPGAKYDFRLAIVSHVEYEVLAGLQPCGEFDDQSLLAALNTLFRAAGLRDGVEMRVEVTGR